MQKINLKIVVWFCVFISLIVTQSCATRGNLKADADGRVIPRKGFFSISRYEYLCEPTLGISHTDLEKLLDRYGNEGWVLGGFLTKEGNTYAFCMQR